MSKLPFMQFYPGDWIKDTRCLSLEARGAWIDLLCAMWEAKPRGKISWPLRAYDQFLGTIEHDGLIYSASGILEELSTLGIAEVVTDSNGIVTLTSRRIVREETVRNQTLERVKRFRSVSSNGSETDLKRRIYQKSEVRSQNKDKNTPDGFDRFWAIYPRRVGRASALKVWLRLQPTPELVAQILAAVGVQAQSDGWRKDNGQYIPHPATWLNGKRWEDEQTTAPRRIPIVQPTNGKAITPEDKPIDRQEAKRRLAELTASIGRV